MACTDCINNCCQRWCVDKLDCLLDCANGCGCCHIPIMMGPNQSWHAGEIIAQKDDDLRFYVFDPNATDGTQHPLGIAMWNVESDAMGNAINRYFNAQVPSASGCGQPYTNMYICGIFRTQELRGQVGAARAAGLLKRKEGNDSAGIVKLV